MFFLRGRGRILLGLVGVFFCICFYCVHFITFALYVKGETDGLLAFFRVAAFSDAGGWVFLIAACAAGRWAHLPGAEVPVRVGYAV